MTLWVLSWDNIGLEAVINLTELHEQYVFDTLAETNKINPIPRILDKLDLRARYNSHREYEIYTIHTEDVDEDEIREYFYTNPTEFKNLVRGRANNRLFPNCDPEHYYPLNNSLPS